MKFPFFARSSKSLSSKAAESAFLHGVPLPPEGILFMNKTAGSGVRQGTSHAKKLAACGINVRDGLILDVGCGWGRLAYGLLNTRFTGTYVGVDIVKDRIDWLTQHFTSVHPRYRFLFSDVRNALYNPAGALTRMSFDPIVGGSAPDTIVLLSVFTHMYEDDIAGYLASLSAVMSPSSSLMFSCFLFDGIAQAGIKRGKAKRRFQYELSPECRYDIKEMPLSAIAYTEARMTHLMTQAGLTGRTIRGNWSTGTAGEWAQDVVIAKKTPSDYSVGDRPESSINSRNETMAGPSVKRDDAKNNYVVRMSVGTSRIRCIIPTAEISGGSDAELERAVLKKAGDLGRGLYESLRNK